MFLKVKVLGVSGNQWPHFALCFLLSEANPSLYMGREEAQASERGNQRGDGPEQEGQAAFTVTQGP